MPPRAVQFGPDVIVVEPDKVIVFARREMDEWCIREFSRTCVVFEGERFYPRFKFPEKSPFAVRYELLRWPRERTEPSGKTIYYDEEYVRNREADVVAGLANRLSSSLLIPLYPLLGLLPRRAKRWLGEAFGVPSVQATRASIWLEAFLLLGCAIFWSWTGGIAVLLLAFGGIGEWGIWTAGSSFLVMCALITFVVDVLVRLDQIIRGLECPDGLLEWVTRLHKPEPLLARSATKSKR